MQVFMTQRDKLTPIHEPFGDAFYYGPERMSLRFENDEKTRLESGFSQSTYATIFERVAREREDVISPPILRCYSPPCLACLPAMFNPKYRWSRIFIML